jgi:archaeal flagellar protein FlaF
MAVSEIIGAAIGVILLVVVAYVIVGSVLIAGETIANTQKDLTMQQESRIRTSITISNMTNQNGMILAEIANTGTEIISDFKHMDVIVYDNDFKDYRIYPFTSDDPPITPSRWGIANRYDEFIHPYELDPGERYQIQINTEGNSPKWFQITTANGVYASATPIVTATATVSATPTI